MYVFRPDRHLLAKNIEGLSHYVTGRTLDIGAGSYDRYGRYFKKASEYIRMDVEGVPHVDVTGSIYKIPFPDASFDSVVCTEVFEHLSHPWKGAAEIKRVLKKGGKVLITVPQMSPLHEIPHDYFRYTSWGLQAIFEDFKTLEMRQLGGYYATLATMRICLLWDSWG